MSLVTIYQLWMTSQKRPMRFAAMQGRRPSTCRQRNGIILENDYLNQRKRIRVQVSCKMSPENSHKLAKSNFINRATSGSADPPTIEFPDHGLVRDGTPCGENLVCVNQTCVSLFPYIDTSKCPTSNANGECSGNGVKYLENF